MKVSDAIGTMLAVREYRDTPIAEDMVRNILEAGRLTGSSRNRQPWHFVVVQDRETLKQLGQLASTGAYIAHAPMAVAVLVPEQGPGTFDGARAIQDMMLVAWEAGIGSNVVTNVDTPEVRALLGVPAELNVLAVVPFGYPARSIGRKVRKPLAEIAHRGRFGVPFVSA